MARLALALAALALGACASPPPIADAAKASYAGGTAYSCPEIDPAQPNCKVPR